LGPPSFDSEADTKESESGWKYELPELVLTKAEAARGRAERP